MGDQTAFRQKAIRMFLELAVAIAVQGFLLTALWSYVVGRAEEARQQRILLLSFEEEKQGFTRLEADYRTVKPHLATIEGALPSEETLYLAVEALENIALKNGTRITVALEAPSAVPADVPGTRSIPFVGSMDGGLLSVRAYLKALEDAPLFVRVHSIRVSGVNIAGAEGAATLHGRIYIR